MKKLLSLILVCSLAFTAQAKSDSLNSQITEIKDTSQATFDKVYSDIKDGLKGLGSALKVGSEHVYEVLCKQQLVISISLLIMLIVSIIMISISYKMYKNDNILWDDISIPNVFCVFLFLLGLFSLVIGLLSLDCIITGFLNPEYGAIKDIVIFIK